MNYPENDRDCAKKLNNVERNNALYERTVLELYAIIKDVDRDAG
ncbi:hypothetical protein [Haladaptatus halobius]|nr:hypothetical protein [Haladaptatus halobius]